MPVRRKITALAVGAVAISGGLPAGASAAEPGFTVDPQSPAGVEYQIPLDSARGQGGGGTGHGHHGGGGLGGSSGGGTSSGGGASGGGGSSAGTPSSNLFGAGIAPATGSSGSAGGTGSASGGTGGTNGGGGASGGGVRHLPRALTASADYSPTRPGAGLLGAHPLGRGGPRPVPREAARRAPPLFS